MHHVFRHYYHEGMGDQSIHYLSEPVARHLPAMAWMPLGLARLRALPPAYSLGLLDRAHLWSWIGSTGGKHERAEMLAALDAHPRGADIRAAGFLRHFGQFVGADVEPAEPESLSAWEYTMLMHQTQFVPVPAGQSAEQFRLWEAFEAGG